MSVPDASVRGCPAGQPFSTPNLGAALAAAGRTFIGYSESLPSVGYQGESFTANPPLNESMRKHNPWMNWVAATPTGSQLPGSVAQPFTAFPADPTTLPSVAFVIPNEQHNMHDGTIAAPAPDDRRRDRGWSLGQRRGHLTRRSA